MAASRFQRTLPFVEEFLRPMNNDQLLAIARCLHQIPMFAVVLVRGRNLLPILAIPSWSVLAMLLVRVRTIARERIGARKMPIEKLIMLALRVADKMHCAYFYNCDAKAECPTTV